MISALGLCAVLEHNPCHAQTPLAGSRDVDVYNLHQADELHQTKKGIMEHLSNAIMARLRVPVPARGLRPNHRAALLDRMRSR